MTVNRPYRAYFAIALSALLVMAMPTPVGALPGQHADQAINLVKNYGWAVTRTNFEPRFSYGFSGQNDWRPIQGRTAFESREFGFSLGVDGLVESEYLRFGVNHDYINGDLQRADGEWRRFVRDFYPPAISTEILDANPVAAITARTNLTRNRILILAGATYVYQVHATDTFIDSTLSRHRPDSSFSYEVRIYPTTNLGKLVAGLRSYSQLIPIPAAIGSKVLDLPIEPSAIRRARLASLREPASSDLRDESQSFEGIGIKVSRSLNGLWVMEVGEGGPAWRAGLRNDDRIISIDGVDATLISQDEATRKIRGLAGTKVSLLVERSGQAPMMMVVTRGRISGLL